MKVKTLAQGNAGLLTNKPGIFRREWSRHKFLYILATPVILYYLIFLYAPMFGIVIAFRQFNIGQGLAGIFTGEFVGLQHFVDFLTSRDAFRVIRNTFMISFWELLFGFPVPIIFALLLNELRSAKFKKVAQTATYLPHFISLVVMSGIIVNFFSATGLATRFFGMFGGPQINLLGRPEFFQPIFIGTNIWQGFGWGSIIYIAALAGVDQELYEAADIDGANRWRKLWAITIPGIMPTIIIMLILNIGQMMSVGFEKIILLYSPATYETADVIASFVFRRGIQHAQYSFSAAVGLFQSVINFTLLLMANRICARAAGTSLF